MADRTLILVKPDGFQRGLVGEIISRWERKGWKLVGLKAMVTPRAVAEQHYAEHNGKPFFAGLVDFITSGPLVAMVWEGKGVIEGSRALIGATNPLTAAAGTVRGDFAIDVGRNIIHGSDSKASADREIALWFKPEELISWDQHLKGDILEKP
jgi:nucleoside-diphosphate kinase